MSDTLNGFGFRAVRSLQGGNPRITKYGGNGYDGIATNDSTAIYIGDAVKVSTSTGKITRAAAGDTLAGIFAGCQFKNSDGKLKKGRWDGASTNTNVIAYVYGADNVFAVQADAATVQADMMDAADVVATAGSTVTGLSAEVLNGTAAGGTANFQIIGLHDIPSNAWTDTYPVVLVKLYEPQLAG